MPGLRKQQKNQWAALWRCQKVLGDGGCSFACCPLELVDHSQIERRSHFAVARCSSILMPVTLFGGIFRIITD